MNRVQRRWKNTQSEGLTILEVMIGIAAVAVIALVLVPGANSALHPWRIDKASDSLYEALNQSRLEAANRGSTTRVCPSSNGRTCRTKGGWDLGWIVFSDGNGDGRVQEFELIAAYETEDSGVRVSAMGAVEKTASFNITGLEVANPDVTAASGEFHICYRDSTANGKRIVVQQDGWIVQRELVGAGCQNNAHS